MRRALLLFLDGVGLGEADASVNPFAGSAATTLRELLGGRSPVRDAAPIHGPVGSLTGMDARLATEGIPQSGTGQTSLLTGVNAAHAFGRHFGPWVPTALRPLLRERSIFRRAHEMNLRAAFANAYPEEVHGRTRAAGFLRAAFPLAADAERLLTRHTDALRAGDAVASEITNDGWIDHLQRDVPRISACEAGTRLAAIALQNDLTVFAHYTTDRAGHSRDMEEARHAVQRVDEFLRGLLEAAPEHLAIVIGSDHGNLEDVRVGHTRNDAMLLAIGPGRERITERVRSLTDLADAVLEHLAPARAGAAR